MFCMPEYTDSHEDLIEHFAKRDQGLLLSRDWVRVEFTPGDIPADLGTWQLRVDEWSCHDWVDLDVLRTRLVALVSRHLISAPHRLLLGDWYILIDGAKVDSVKNARIVFMYDNSRVDSLCDNSRVTDMYNNSRVTDMCNNSRVDSMRDSSQVDSMRDNSRVDSMYHNSRVTDMYNNSRVTNPTRLAQ